MTRNNCNRSFTRAALAALLALAALPAFADPATGGMGADRADAPADTRAALPDSMTLSDRALMLASDINRLIVPGARAATPSQAPASGRVQSVLSRAFALLGTPYRWGGTSPDGGFDCSGLVGYVFRNALGVELPRVSRDMAQTGAAVERSQLNAGDLVFFSTHSRGVDHVGIYIGDGKFLHAPRTGRDVTVSNLDTGYWNGKFIQARRVAGI
jgi:cell wall-associated NlpC family hydrolase